MKTPCTPPQTRSELVSLLEDKEEMRIALVHKMSDSDIPPSSDTFKALVTQKQDIIIEIEGLRNRINVMDHEEKNPNGYAPMGMPTINYNIEH